MVRFTETRGRNSIRSIHLSVSASENKSGNRRDGARSRSWPLRSLFRPLVHEKSLLIALIYDSPVDLEVLFHSTPLTLRSIAMRDETKRWDGTMRCAMRDRKLPLILLARVQDLQFFFDARGESWNFTLPPILKSSVFLEFDRSFGVFNGQSIDRLTGSIGRDELFSSRDFPERTRLVDDCKFYRVAHNFDIVFTKFDDSAASF